MRLFNFKKRTEELSPPISDALLRALLSNETITREQALTLPSVSSSVNLIASIIASMPIKLYKHSKGKVQSVDDDVRVKLLNQDTGDTLDAFQMKNAMVMDFLLDGNAYCYIERERNEFKGLHYVKDESVTINQSQKAIYKVYTLMCDTKTFEGYEFIKLLRNTRDGATGNGVIAEVGKAIETAYNTMVYQLNLVKTGGNKKGFLKSQRKLGNDEVDVLKAAWRNLYQNNEENVVILNSGLEFQEASNSSVEMQLNESKKTLNDEIRAIFHIGNSFEETFKLAIYPIIKAFETALNRDLLLEKEKGKYFFEFDVKEITKASVKERYESYKLAKDTGFMTTNEIRQSENLNYIEGLDIIDFGLGSVLFNTETQEFYTPNTDTTKATLPQPTDNIEGKEEVEDEN